MMPVRSRSWMAARAERACGWLALREARLAGAAIVLYHGIVESPACDVLGEYTIDVKTFEAHLHWFRRHGDVVSIVDIVDCIRERRMPDPRWVVLTFDDALLNQATIAADILGRHRVPWTIAVPAGLIGTGRTIWSYELRFLLHRCWTDASIPLPLPRSGRIATTTESDRVIAERQIRQVLFTETPPGERQNYLRGLIHAVGSERFSDELMADGRFLLAQWDDLRRLRSPLVTVCSHGWTHSPQTDAVTLDDLAVEFADSRQRIADELGDPPHGFALPHGVSSSDTTQAAATAGYDWCLTSRPGRVSISDDRMALPRFSGEYPLAILRRSLSKAW